jgi:hypothetical protein
MGRVGKDDEKEAMSRVLIGRMMSSVNHEAWQFRVKCRGLGRVMQKNRAVLTVAGIFYGNHS